MGKVADEFEQLFKRSLESKLEKKDNASFERLSRYILGLEGLRAVDECLARYLDIHARDPKEDPRSDMCFLLLVGLRLERTLSDDEFIDRLYTETRSGSTTKWPVAVRARKLPTQRRNDLEEKILKARDSMQKSRSLVDSLRQMHLRDNERSAKSFDELYAFSPLSDAKLRAEFEKISGAVQAAFSSAGHKMVEANIGYDKATKAQEEKRLASSGYEGFKARMNEWRAFLKRQKDDRALFQLLKWTRDVFRPSKGSVRGGSTYVDRELYLHVVFALYLHAIQVRKFARSREGFTAEEEQFFLEPLRGELYASNLRNRIKYVFHDGKANIDAFYALADTYARLYLWGRTENLDLVDDARALEIQKAVLGTPDEKLRARSFSTKGIPGPAHARGDFKLGWPVGPDMYVVYFEGSPTKTVYLERAGLQGILFEASVGQVARIAESRVFHLVWESTKGLIPLIQKLFEVIGYMPVLVEGGFAAMVKQVLRDQVTGGTLEVASNLTGKDLSMLEMVVPLLSRKKKAGSGTALDEARANTPAQKALTSGDAKAVAKVEQRALMQDANRLIKPPAKPARGADFSERIKKAVPPPKPATVPDMVPRLMPAPSPRQRMATNSAGLSVVVHESASALDDLKRIGFTFEVIPVKNPSSPGGVFHRTLSPIEMRVTSPSGLKADIDILAVDPLKKGRLIAQDAKYTSAERVRDSGHLAKVGDKEAQIATHVLMAAESNGLLRAEVVGSANLIADMYLNVAEQGVALKMKKEFRERVKAYLSREAGKSIKNISLKDVDRLVDKYFDLAIHDLTPPRRPLK
jgi:hypothetical protein